MNKDNKLLSKCHSARLTINTGYEGTSYWICTKCNKPTDPKPMQNDKDLDKAWKTLSLCSKCYCMTKTIDGACGKCKEDKPEKQEVEEMELIILQDLVDEIGEQVTRDYEAKHGLWEGISISNSRSIDKALIRLNQLLSKQKQRMEEECSYINMKHKEWLDQLKMINWGVDKQKQRMEGMVSEADVHEMIEDSRNQLRKQLEGELRKELLKSAEEKLDQAINHMRLFNKLKQQYRNDLEGLKMEITTLKRDPDINSFNNGYISGNVEAVNEFNAEIDKLLGSSAEAGE